jgi:hypothetical protein
MTEVRRGEKGVCDSSTLRLQSYDA